MKWITANTLSCLGHHIPLTVFLGQMMFELIETYVAIAESTNSALKKLFCEYSLVHVLNLAV